MTLHTWKTKLCNVLEFMNKMHVVIEVQARVEKMLCWSYKLDI